MATVETQRVAGAVFLEILQRNLVPIQTYSQTFLSTVLLGMDNRDPGISKKLFISFGLGTFSYYIYLHR